MTAVAQDERADRADEGSRGAGRRRPAAARARVGQGGRAADPVHPRLVAEPPLLGEAVRERARRRVPARGVRPPRPRHVRGAARAGELHRRQALGRRRRGDHRPAAISTGRCSSAGPTAPSSSATTCARTARIESPRSTSSRARSSSGEAAFGTLIGPGFLDHFVGRHGRRPADQHPGHARLRQGVRGEAARRPTTSRRRCAGTSSCRRGSAPNLAAREIDCDDVLRALEVPLLVTQGRADTVVLPAMAEHVLATCPTAEASWYDGVGHVPHLEEPERFNRELAALTRSSAPVKRDAIAGVGS